MCLVRAPESCEKPQGNDTTPAADPHTDVTAAPRAPSSPPQPGAVGRLGEFRLLRLLGKGGLGEVYEALDPADRRIALKVFALGDDSEGLIAGAFVREATLGQRLDHPDIVKVLGSGSLDRYAYLAMEFVAGHDLRVHTRPGHLLPVADALGVVERVARGVAAAHAQQVIHRDLKPGNVLVNWPAGVVKVADFGLARLGDAFRSRTGMIAGTPSYMSPEQLAETPIGPASDLYALGVMLFELLTGRLPHEASSLGQLLIEVSSQQAPDLRSLRPSLPAELAELVASLLEKRPARRPASAVVVADRLAGIRAQLG